MFCFVIRTYIKNIDRGYNAHMHDNESLHQRITICSLNKTIMVQQLSFNDIYTLSNNSSGEANMPP